MELVDGELGAEVVEAHDGAGDGGEAGGCVCQSGGCGSVRNVYVREVLESERNRVGTFESCPKLRRLVEHPKEVSDCRVESARFGDHHCGAG